MPDDKTQTTVPTAEQILAATDPAKDAELSKGITTAHEEATAIIKQSEAGKKPKALPKRAGAPAAAPEAPKPEDPPPAPPEVEKRRNYQIAKTFIWKAPGAFQASMVHEGTICHLTQSEVDSMLAQGATVSPVAPTVQERIAHHEAELVTLRRQGA